MLGVSMRPALVVLGISLIATVAEARPLPDPAPWVLPVNALAKAKVGDWTILEGDAVLGGRTLHQREIIRVGSIAGGIAELQLFEGKAGREGWFLSFPVDLARGPDTNLLFDVPWIAVDQKSAKATCTMGDASFACTKVTYRTPTHTVTAFMAARVRGSGLVAFDVVRDGQSVWKMTTVGYGNGGKVEWGAGPPRADLQGNWDGGAAAVALRDGTEPATADVYEVVPPPPLAMPPRADLVDCHVGGDLDRNIVRRFIQRKLTQIEDCYAEALAGNRKLGGGTIELAFTIDELSAAIELSATGTAPMTLRPCAADAVTAIQFPYADGGGRSSVTCTFTFDPGHPAPPKKKPTKPRLLHKAHPARGGPDLRGLQRIP